MFGIESLTKKETINIILTIAGHVFVTGGFFCTTALFYKEKTTKYLNTVQHFSIGFLECKEYTIIQEFIANILE